MGGGFGSNTLGFTGGGASSGGGGGTGTVTSVGITAPAALFTTPVSGSPVTTSGTFALALASQSANLVFASPNGSSGTPTFRALTGTDMPLTFNQIAFGNSSNQQTSSANLEFVASTQTLSVTGVSTASTDSTFTTIDSAGNILWSYRNNASIWAGYYSNALLGVSTPVYTAPLPALFVQGQPDSSPDTINVNNTFLGINSGAAWYSASNTTRGRANTLIGWHSGNFVTTGSLNTFIGYNNGTGISTGNQNTIIGSGNAASTGGLSSCIVIGASTGVFKSNNNIGIGNNLSLGNVTGSGNLIINANNGTRSTSVNSSNSISLNGQATGSNQMVIGDGIGGSSQYISSLLLSGVSYADNNYTNIGSFLIRPFNLTGTNSAAGINLRLAAGSGSTNVASGGTVFLSVNAGTSAPTTNTLTDILQVNGHTGFVGISNQTAAFTPTYQLHVSGGAVFQNPAGSQYFYGDTSLNVQIGDVNQQILATNLYVNTSANNVSIGGYYYNQSAYYQTMFLSDFSNNKATISGLINGGTIFGQSFLCDMDLGTTAIGDINSIVSGTRIEADYGSGNTLSVFNSTLGGYFYVQDAISGLNYIKVDVASQLITIGDPTSPIYFTMNLSSHVTTFYGSTMDLATGITNVLLPQSVTINSLAYNFPASFPAVTGVLTCDASGNLSWV